jgi:hypothetical protein
MVHAAWKSGPLALGLAFRPEIRSNAGLDMGNPFYRKRKRGKHPVTSPRETFQELLRDLFQFDCADLDFGIYRIMNYKRDAIEAFISEELPETVGRELDRGIIARQNELAQALSEKKTVVSG